ncbi:MAG: hypothetical protein J0I06_11805, partial [Planctomycetes bacterium]|nr:hypothetical protein [Planctomycetota bacterium]
PRGGPPREGASMLKLLLCAVAVLGVLYALGVVVMTWVYAMWCGGLHPSIIVAALRWPVDAAELLARPWRS